MSVLVVYAGALPVAADRSATNGIAGSRTPQAEIKGKDKGLLKEIAAFEEDEAEQVHTTVEE